MWFTLFHFPQAFPKSHKWHRNTGYPCQYKDDHIDPGWVWLLLQCWKFSLKTQVPIIHFEFLIAHYNKRGLKWIHIYWFGIPGFVKELLGNFCDKVKDRDAKHDEETNDSPGCLPKDIWFVSNHELNIFIESGSNICQESLNKMIKKQTC